MKKYFFYLFLSLLVAKLSSAQYNKLIEETKIWQYRGFPNLDGPCGLNPIGVSNDTLINGITYFNIGELFNGTVVPNFGILLREDTVSKKVHAFYPYNSPPYEELIYNFSVNAGDTLYQIDSTVVVDSVFYENYEGINRKTFIFRDTAGKSLDYLWIEGIGDTISLLNPFIDISSYICMSHLVCVSQDSSSIYSRPNNFCYLPFMDIDEIASKEMPKVFPNPCGGFLTVILPENELTVQLEMSDLRGRIVFQGFYSTSTITIQTSFLKSGIYLLKLHGNQTTVTKIIVE